ncbi:hypothetical protein D9615_008931 [Tricholomella constricta]|uniref:Neutral ceramidase n=1 Tax=Tricholomella constricta TaxID=117010 RepID=A0A8H5H0Z6_9AGAR|nr:hypothetical protein D9615_008931 [Tricholomella constricta]
MPLLSYHSALPLDLWNLPRALYDTMTGIVWYLTAFVAATSLFSETPMAIQAVSAQYLLGLGVGDITGPVVETNMMGYASLDQTDTGLHMRQRSRAFIIADAASPSHRVVFINADIAMGDTGVRRSIVARLAAQFPGVYTDGNIAFVGTHQHAGVGGYLENLLPQITSLGYVKQTADAIVAGTVRAVQRAHASLAPGSLSVGNTTILDANINRSPTAYLANPAAERARYQHDQDKEMTVLRFDDANGNARGLLSFFPVHGTSLYGNNTLVSTDNKGMAAFLYEASVEPSTMPGNTSFIAGFTQSNVGDTSPNTLGAFCESPGKEYHGLPCETNHSTCGGKVQDCHGRGPGFRISDFESNRIIGDKQFKGAQAVMSGPRSPHAISSLFWHLAQVGVFHSLQGDAHLQTAERHPSLDLPRRYGLALLTTCLTAGYSFAGGTTDGPGALDFIQGDNSSTPQNPFWEIVKGAITPLPSATQKACQDPKPILLNTGFAHFPYEWAPSTVNVQMLRVGNFVMLIVPGEMTTMAGRRMREALRAKLISSGVLGSDAYVVIAGPANTYGHYVTTREEYGVQRYEGASTIFGQHTLDAYIDKYSSLVPFLAENASGTPASDPPPPEQTSKAISLQTGVVFDSAPIGKKFGAVLVDVKTSPAYHAGETVSAQFVGANPRVQYAFEQPSAGEYVFDSRSIGVRPVEDGALRLPPFDKIPVAQNKHCGYSFAFDLFFPFIPFLIMHVDDVMRRPQITGTSTVTISWTIESGTPAGTYRLSYFGDSKPLIGSISAFSGVSSSFTVAA